MYLSRPIKLKKNGGLVLGDFGEARFGQTTYTDLIQPEPYRAPEVMLGMPWDEKVDIWSVGTMVRRATHALHILVLISLTCC